MFIIFTVCFVQPGTMVKCFFSQFSPSVFQCSLHSSLSYPVHWCHYRLLTQVSLCDWFSLFILFGVTEHSAGRGAKNNLDAALKHVLSPPAILLFFWVYPCLTFRRFTHMLVQPWQHKAVWCFGMALKLWGPVTLLLGLTHWVMMSIPGRAAHEIK